LTPPNIDTATVLVTDTLLNSPPLHADSMARHTLIFPPGPTPRTWLITAGASPIGVRLARGLLEHGDNVVLGALVTDLARIPSGFLSAAQAGKSDPAAEPAAPPGTGQFVEDDERDDERPEIFARFVVNEVAERGWRARTKVVGLDARCESGFVVRWLL
jgi:hypothetical protein